MNVVKRNTVPFPSIIDEFLKPDWLGGMQTMQATIPAVNIKESSTSFLIELAAADSGSGRVQLYLDGHSDASDGWSRNNAKNVVPMDVGSICRLLH